MKRDFKQKELKLRHPPFSPPTPVKREKKKKFISSDYPTMFQSSFVNVADKKYVFDNNVNKELERDHILLHLINLWKYNMLSIMQKIAIKPI